MVVVVGAPLQAVYLDVSLDPESDFEALLCFKGEFCDLLIKVL